MLLACVWRPYDMVLAFLDMNGQKLAQLYPWISRIVPSPITPY